MKWCVCVYSDKVMEFGVCAFSGRSVPSTGRKVMTSMRTLTHGRGRSTWHRPCMTPSILRLQVVNQKAMLTLTYDREKSTWRREYMTPSQRLQLTKQFGKHSVSIGQRDRSPSRSLPHGSEICTSAGVDLCRLANRLSLGCLTSPIRLSGETYALLIYLLCSITVF